MPKTKVLSTVIVTQHNPNAILHLCGLSFPRSLQITVSGRSYVLEISDLACVHWVIH